MPLCRKLFQIETLDDVGPALHEQMYMHGHGRIGYTFEGDGIGTSGKDVAGTQPARAGEAGSGSVDFGDEARGVIPEAGPAGAEQDHIAGLNPDGLRGDCTVQEIGRDFVIGGQGCVAEETGDIEKDTPAEDRLDGIDGEIAETLGVGLNSGGLASVVKNSAAGEVTQRVDMSADVPAESDRFGGRTDAAGSEVVAVLFDQRKEKGWMTGMMRHADEPGLAQIHKRRSGHKLEEVGEPAGHK